MQAASIVVVKQRGYMVVQALGQTPRGQRYIKAYRVLKCTSPADPNFKKEMAAAVEELVGTEA